MKKLNIALICGGISSEREVSLAGGEQVFKALDKSKYNVERYDPKFDLKRLVEDAGNIDAALLILHGPYGEDGTIQGMLELLGIPYQGSGVLGSAVAMNKLVSKQLYEKVNLPTPPYMALTKEDTPDLDRILEIIGLPLMVKPVENGSSIGMTLCRTRESLMAAFKDAFRYDDVILIESYIKGVELTGGVIGNATLEPLPIVEILPNADHAFFNYHAKYTKGQTQEICPARINATLTEKAQRYAQKAHQVLFCKGYSRTDMILKDDELYLLETNTIPGMTPTSLLPQAAEAAGISFAQLIDKLIELSIEGK